MQTYRSLYVGLAVAAVLAAGIAGTQWFAARQSPAQPVVFHLAGSWTDHSVCRLDNSKPLTPCWITYRLKPNGTGTRSFEAIGDGHQLKEIRPVTWSQKGSAVIFAMADRADGVRQVKETGTISANHRSIYLTLASWHEGTGAPAMQKSVKMDRLFTKD